MPKIIVIAHNIRSTHNVGSIFRTCEGFGVHKLILSGYTPYPDLAIDHSAPACAYVEGEQTTEDPRLPHIRQKITKDIHKTALGAEALVPFEYHETLNLDSPDLADYELIALEQNERSIPLSTYSPAQNVALLLGEEVNGIIPQLLNQCSAILEIPMHGQKESFNVSVATGIALYALTT